MVARSLVLWDELAQETGHYLYTETGVLTLGQPDDGHTLTGYDVMRTAGLPVERLTAEECRQRFPQFNPRAYKAIVYNSTGGMLHASDCLLAPGRPAACAWWHHPRGCPCDTRRAERRWWPRPRSRVVTP